jgi:peptidoglycan/xylan/chitin deacetylase (PgdA/CDA1 family)
MRVSAVVVLLLAGTLASATAESASRSDAAAPPAAREDAASAAFGTTPADAKPAAGSEAMAGERPATAPSDLKSEPSAVGPATPPDDSARPRPPASDDAAGPSVRQAAGGCPGNPDALGTSRVLTISPGEFTLLGTIQYRQTLPLEDHEVVLTFDDGPIPPYTNSVLDTLAAQCVRATYFLVGQMARARPYLVRRIYNEGHSIGTHSEHHPFAFQRLSMQRVEREVDGGIDSVKGALGDAAALSPFFRIPGFGRTNAIEQFLESKKLVTWSADIDTDDWWRGSTPGAIVQRAMRRLNEKGRGIILMHDIHPATALALPILLKELKANGYRIVHVVPAGAQPKSLPEVVATPAEKETWPRLSRDETKNEAISKKALRHRVKLALDQRPHHRHRKAKRGESIDYANTGSSDERLTRPY